MKKRGKSKRSKIRVQPFVILIRKISTPMLKISIWLENFPSNIFKRHK
jgi:hypothetical protein